MSWSKFFKAAGKAIASASNSPTPSKPKTVPVMTMDMIQSNGGPITSTQAIKLFKEFALKSGYLDKDELTEHAGYFSDEMKEHGGFLEDEAAGDISSLKEQLKELRARRKGETDKQTKEELDEEIKSALEDLEEETEHRQPAIRDLAAFKADKRQFLIEYMNRQTQGR